MCGEGDVSQRSPPTKLSPARLRRAGAFLFQLLGTENGRYPFSKNVLEPLRLLWSRANGSGILRPIPGARSSQTVYLIKEPTGQ